MLPAAGNGFCLSQPEFLTYLCTVDCLDWFAAIWIDGVYATRIAAILKQLRAAFGSINLRRNKEPIRNHFFI